VNIPSIVRSLRKKFFGATPARRRPFRRPRGLHVEPLERRELLSGDTPFVTAVVPTFGSVVNLNTTPHPAIKVTFSEPVTGATTAANYSLFDATGHAVFIDSVTPDAADPTKTFDLNYNSGQPLTAGTYTLFVEGDQIVDTDGDNRPVSQPGQVVVANQGQNNLALLKEPGDGSLIQSGTLALPAGTKISAVTSADLNNDGFPDLVVADKANSLVYVFLGTGPGTYGAPTAYSTIVSGKGASPVSVAVGTLKGIGTGPAIVTASSADGVVSILANDGSGHFTGASTAGVGPGPNQVVLGDLDNKNGNDIVVSHSSVAGSGVSVLLAKGDGTFQPATEVAPGTAKPTAVALADFNRDGKLDLAIADNSATGAVIVLNGLGDGTFGLPTSYAVGVNPTSLTIADVNRDGFPDIIAVSGSLTKSDGSFKAPPDPVSVLLNAQGAGFDPSIRSSLRNDVGLNNVVAMSLNRDPFPDLVTSADAKSQAKENLFTLLGNGDGTYTLLSSQVAGDLASSTATVPSFETVASDPFIPVTTFTAIGTTVSVDLVRNGGFEDTDLASEQGNLSGWLNNNLTSGVTGSHGLWDVQTGTQSPLSLVKVPAPPGGKFQAMLDQPDLMPIDPSTGNPNTPDSYQGSHALYQDIAIPDTASSAALSLSLFFKSDAPFTDPGTNPSLDFLTTSGGKPLANQQIRVDIMNPAAGLYEIKADAPGQPGVLRTLFQTVSGTPTTQSLTLGGGLTFDLSLFKGRTIRLRIATVNNAAAAPPFGDDKLIVGVDNVKLQTTFTDTQAPAFTISPHLRNPGLNNDTTDQTLVGQVNDNGSINNISLIQIDPTNSGFLPANVINLVPGPGSIDAQGNFVKTLSLLPGTYNMGIRVIDQAGNMTSTTLAFTYQGPSNSVWQAQGPGPVNVPPTAVDYKTVSGRVTSTVVDPSDPTGNTYYVGSANGGVWKTVDGGADWTPLMDFLTDPAGNRIPAAIGGLAEGFKNPDASSAANVLYAATGVGDNAVDSRAGLGVLKSTDFGKTWTLIGNSSTVLANARVSKVVVDRNDPNIAYVAVTSGGAGGPGVYQTTDGGLTWNDVLLVQNMFDDSGNALPGGTTLPSVTDMIIDPFNSNLITIGLGNIGQVDVSAAAGVWQTATRGATWHEFGKHDDPALNAAGNADLPKGTALGRVTIAQGSGSPGIDEAYIYVLIGTPPPANGQTAGSYNQGTGVDDTGGYPNQHALAARAVSGLYRTRDAGRNWTKVMLRENLNGNTPTFPERFADLNLLGKDSSNAGALIVDPTDPNVVFVGGSERFLPPPPIMPVMNVFQPPEHGIIRVDTGNMRDTQFIDPFTGMIPNDGDDQTKALWGYHIDPKGSYRISGAAYIGEGVYWYDLIGKASSGNGFALAMPGAAHSFAIDAQGRLIVGTEEGVWRGVTRGFGYDFTSGSFAFNAGVLFTKPNPAGSIYPLFVQPPGLTLTELNGNLQTFDQTAVAIDPTHPGTLYSSQFGSATSTHLTGGGLTWVTTGPDLVGPTVPVYGNRDIPNGVTVRVTGPVPGAPPGSPINVYRNWEYIEFAAATVERSADGGTTFIVPGSPGISITEQSSLTPPLAVNPTKVFESGAFQDELLFGTNRVYLSRTSGNTWTDVVGHPLNTSNANEVVTALAFGPEITARLPGIYAGTDQGEVFVDLHGGADGFPNRSSGLPGPGHRINGIAVSPTNPLDAYAAVGGQGAGHLFHTTDGGQHWTDVSGNLPNFSTYSVVVDPRTLPSFPTGRIFVGTEVGVYESVDGGKSWQRLGQGLPNVPVVDLQLNTDQNTLAAATSGRSTFIISVDVFGVKVVSFTPANPTSPGIASVTVTFNDKINPSTMNVGAVTITGPNGQKITPLSVVSTDTDPNSPTYNTTFRINFQPLVADGGYTFTVGPNVTDVEGNAMDQDGNGINGEPTDVFTFQVAVNSTDDGRFVSGLYNDILGRAVDTGSFLAFVSQIDAARFSVLAGFANSFVLSQPARAQLITDLFGSSSTPPSALGLGDLLGVSLTPDQANAYVALLNQGVSVETIIDSLVSSPDYFNQSRAGHTVNGLDANFVTQLFLDLLGRTPLGNEQSGNVAQLQLAEYGARNTLMNALVRSPAYLSQYITSGAGALQGSTFSAQGYLGILGTLPDPNADIPYWVNAFQHGTTEQQFITTLMATPAFFNRAWQIVNHYAPADPDGVSPSTLRSFIKAVYYELFPNVVITEDQVQGWLNAFAAGTTRAQMIASLLATPAYLFDPVNGLVAQYYEFYLGRVPTSDEVNGWAKGFASGLRVENFLAALVSTQEFFDAQSPTPPPPTPLGQEDVNWIKAVYTKLTGIDPTGTGLDTAALAALASAERSARLTMAQGLTAGGEYRGHLATMAYNYVLKRNPTTAEANAWVAYLGQGSAGAGQLTRDEQMIASLLGSQEYFYEQADASGLHTNRQWLSSLYPTLHLTTPSSDVITSIVSGSIITAYNPQRQAVINALLNSGEYRANIIKADYLTFLGRAAKADEIASGVSALASGMSDELFLANLLSGPEYFAHAPSVLGLSGATNDTFVRAVFKQLEPWRTFSDADVGYWVNKIQSGQVSRAGFVLAQDTDPSYRFDAVNGLINRLYLHYLGRSATGADNTAWAMAFAHGITDETVIGSIVLSPEYFLRSHPYP
jgi:photosystem II stability/assembly factor-like uncharacterized protein